MALQGLVETECCVCLDKAPTVVLNPCGHKVVCENCYQKIKDSCPVCRTKIVRQIEITIDEHPIVRPDKPFLCITGTLFAFILIGLFVAGLTKYKYN